jgi:hypothetical protein
LPDGRIYDGEWLETAMDGYGTMKYSDGNVYEGQFINNQRHG